MNSVKFLTLAIVCCLPALASAQSTLISETFDGQLPRQWKGGSNVSVANSNLVLDVPAAVQPGDRSAGVVYTDNGQALNFMKAPLSISLHDLDITGSAADQNKVFMLYLTESKAVATAQYSLQLRIDATGNTYLWLYTYTKDKGIQRTRMAQLSCLLPIQSLTIKADAAGCSLTVEDASGKQSASAAWPDTAALNAWASDEYHLLLNGVIKADAGSAVITLGEISIHTGNPLQK